METLIVTLTITTCVSFLALLLGGVIGWVAREHSYETTPQTVYTHPEMFDENGPGITQMGKKSMKECMNLAFKRESGLITIPMEIKI